MEIKLIKRFRIKQTSVKNQEKLSDLTAEGRSRQAPCSSQPSEQNIKHW